MRGGTRGACAHVPSVSECEDVLRLNKQVFIGMQKAHVRYSETRMELWSDHDMTIQTIQTTSLVALAR